MAAKNNKAHSGSCAGKQKKADFSLVSSRLSRVRNERDSLIIRLVAETGCTSKELVNIRPEDIRDCCLIVRAENAKNKTERKIFLGKRLGQDLKAFADENRPYVFSSKRSSRLSTRSVRKIFEKCFGGRMTSGRLRKLHIKEALGKGRPIEEIRKSTGIKRLDKKLYLTAEEFGRIRKSAQNKRDRLILDILFGTGCTLKELVNIKAGDFEFAKNRLAIKAAGQQRTAAVSGRLSSRIRKFVEDNGLGRQDCLFSTRQSRAMSEKRAFQIIKKCSRKAGLKAAGPQILRYSHIANSLAAGKAVEDISGQTGIRNLSRFHLYGLLEVNKHD